MPPPTGGVSIHLWRLQHLLREDFHISLVDESRIKKKNLLNLRTLNLVGYLKIISQAHVIAIHSGTSSLRYLHIIAAKLLRKRVVLTIHSYPKEKTALARIADRLMFHLPDTIVVVNAEILRRVALSRGKTIVNHAFLPPIMDEEEALPPSINNWIHHAKQSGRKIICGNAYQLSRFDNQDLYGLDMCIEVARRLKNRKIPFRFLFNVATIGRFGDAFTKFQALVDEVGLRDSFSLTNEQFSFVRLMEQSDLVLRPTNTDGDSLTVREALHLGRPIIVSDAVERPPGTILFRNRDIDDLERKVLDTIERVGAGTPQSSAPDPDFYYRFYRTMFLKLSGGS